MAHVSLTGLQKSYGDERIIDHVDLEIDEGEFLTLLGPSGCGKTTTLRIVAGLLSPDSGRVSFDGVDVTNLPTQRRKLGMVFQDYALFPHMTIAENVGFPLRTERAPKREIAKRVKELLSLIRLPAIADRYPSELSGGQQQRIAIARALIRTPSVLLMDEPLGALDLKLREAMQNELHSIQRKLGITTIYVTHDQEEALSLSHRIALMRHGKIEQLDTPRRIYASPKTPFAAFFLGKVNFLQGTVVERSEHDHQISVGGSVVTCPVRRGVSEFRRGAHVVLGIRPEHLHISNSLPNPANNYLSGKVCREKFTGKIVQFDVEIADGTTMVVDGLPEQAHGIGAHVNLVWEHHATHMYPYAEDKELGITSSGIHNRSTGTLTNKSAVADTVMA